MENPQYWSAPVTGNAAGTLNTTGVQCLTAGKLASGYWVVEADVPYYVGTSKSAAVALASLTTGCTRKLAYSKTWIHSSGDTYVSVKAVSATGTYTLNKYE